MQLTTTLLALIPLVAATPGNYGGSYGGSDSSSGTGTTGTVAAAQSGTASAANGVTTIHVGKGGLKMEPNDVTVPNGGLIEFVFYQGAHSVAQSSFDNPCQPLNSTAANGVTGFFSGSQPVQGSGTGANVFRVVSTGQPMWYYCATGRHCQSGQVGVINKPANNAARTIQAYQSLAAAAPANSPYPSVQGGVVVAAGSTTGTGTGTNTGAGSQQTSAAAGSMHDLRMVGLAVGVAAVAFAL